MVGLPVKVRVGDGGEASPASARRFRRGQRWHRPHHNRLVLDGETETRALPKAATELGTAALASRPQARATRWSCETETATDDERPHPSSTTTAWYSWK